jgi:hypothetical protein
MALHAPVLRLSIALTMTAVLPAAASASPSECGDPASRLATAQQFLMQHLPPGADMERFLLQRKDAPEGSSDCPIEVLVTVAFNRASEYPPVESALNAEPTLEVMALEERNDSGGKSRMTFRLQVD